MRKTWIEEQQEIERRRLERAPKIDADILKIVDAANGVTSVRHVVKCLDNNPHNPREVRRQIRCLIERGVLDFGDMLELVRVEEEPKC
jgi:hypothetical protein